MESSGEGGLRARGMAGERERVRGVENRLREREEKDRD